MIKNELILYLKCFDNEKVNNLNYYFQKIVAYWDKHQYIVRHFKKILYHFRNHSIILSRDYSCKFTEFWL